MNSETVTPRTSFDWPLYVDATLAGLALLIPIPLLDVFFEWWFKRRIPGAVARYNGRQLDPYTKHYLNSEPFSCLLWPFSLVLLFLKRLYRTILYFLTIKEASDKLSLYWHRAFLIDYMLRRGDLDSEKSAKVAALAMFDVLNQRTTSPLNSLARQIIGQMHHALRTIWHWRRRQQEDEELQSAKTEMANAWGRFSQYLEEVAADYAETFARFQAAQVADTIVMKPGVESLPGRRRQDRPDENSPD